MKTNSLAKILSAATVVALLSASSAFAQVKIGTNPTTIGANNNLEVEATNNKKVIVHKDNGTVVIENTPSGALTDSVLTVDASGNVREISRVKLLKLLDLSGSAQMTGGSQALNQGDQDIDFIATTFDDEGGNNLTANTFTVKRAGFYTINAEATIQVPLAGPFGATGRFDIILAKDGTGAIGTYNSIDIQRGYLGTGQIIKMLPCAVGDTFRVIVRPCNGCAVGQAGYNLQNSSITVLKNK